MSETNTCPKCGGEMEYKNSIFSRIFKILVYIICGFLSFFFLFGIFYEISDSEKERLHQKREQEAKEKEAIKKEKEQQKLENKALKEQEKLAKKTEKEENKYAKQLVKDAKKYEKQREKEAKEQMAKQSKLTLLEHHSCWDNNYGPSVCGTIKNNTDKTLRSVSVDVDLLDRNGSIVSRTSDFIERLDPYQSWAFKVHITDNNVASYVITKVSDLWGQL